MVSARGYLPNDLMPNTFLATTVDLGDALSPFGSVHTRHKIEVGERLALAALKHAYNESSVYAGPVFASAAATTAGSVTLHFNDTGSKGLQPRPMVINANHSQGNWSGKTPFEVCIPPSGDARPISCLGAGALAAGGDLGAPQNMTIAAATEFCAANASCTGFTTQASGCGASGVQKVYFKSQPIGAPNVDKRWVSFGKELEPCSVLSRYDHWSAPPTVTLGRGGKTIVLSGMAGKVAAVRMAWRAYPCEHLGCGVYSAAENLPPAPFWATVSEAAREATQREE